MAKDSMGVINLLFWDREAKDLYGKSADQMKKELDLVYTVIKFLDDKKVIKKHKLNKEPNVTESVDRGTTSNLSDEMQGNAVNLISNSDPNYSMDALDEPVSTLEAKTPAKRTPKP
ncbi:hypothetical protein PIB30_030718 [Stylosanthes scabra]|uniref:Uncharacterized protein n=1 Tax=Stylosanthes scabra TaxID=79078 RepID=A0ABU6UAE4_9FABA|nr:hypothetical protein [Stylosanthes scabra]